MAANCGTKRSANHSESSKGLPPAKRARHKQSVPVTHALLRCYSLEIQILREYLISRLPSSSRLRRKKIANLGLHPGPSASEALDKNPTETLLSNLLDSTLVGIPHGTHQKHQKEQQGSERDDDRWQQWVSFSQKGDESYVTLSGDPTDALYSQSEIVDFVVWLLFSRAGPTSSWPKHLLCDGYRRSPSHGATGSGIPGLYSLYPNHHVKALKEAPWPQLLMLLGQSGEKMMIDLLVDCAIFVPIQAGVGNLHQLSGIPISELDPNNPYKNRDSRAPNVSTPEVPPSEILFVRTRMLYARPAINARGNVQFGLRHIHVLNRCPYMEPSATEGEVAGAQADSQNEEKTRKVMMYIFPRQFGLHNVFTSTVDRTKTSQKLQDYTLREEEIKTHRQKLASDGKLAPIRIPKRLRGDAMRLVQRLQILHGRCSYTELLRYYCPTVLDAKSTRASTSKGANRDDDSSIENQRVTLNTERPLATSGSRRKLTTKDHRGSRETTTSHPTVTFDTLTDLATPLSQVSAFCQATLSKVIPNEFWGSGPHNKRLIMNKVDHFVKLRRFESMSLGEVADGLKSHVMFYDTGHNSTQTVMRNVFEAFVEATTKMWAYARCLPTQKQPGTKVIIETITKLVDVAYMLLKSKTRKSKYPDYDCRLSKSQVSWLGLCAIRKTLLQKQTRYRELIDWLGHETNRLESKGIKEWRTMRRVVNGSEGLSV
ncbi:hypothetical protein ACRALDRAFT_1070651 [Sodiomyces alcalophilus JCM 7366]|uniref:uncharacterized protein n=1 Tax=Sodiomyces alcalophilus JCM 7366 TaxID=591952 RepID=UPI0039B51EBF